MQTPENSNDENLEEFLEWTEEEEEEFLRIVKEQERKEGDL